MNTVAGSTPNPPDSTHCGLMPLAAGREGVGEPREHADDCRKLYTRDGSASAPCDCGLDSISFAEIIAADRRRAGEPV